MPDDQTNQLQASVEWGEPTVGKTVNVLELLADVPHIYLAFDGDVD